MKPFQFHRSSRFVSFASGVTLLFLASVLCARPCWAQVDAQRLASTAKAAQQNKDWDFAAQSWMKLIDTFPDSNLIGSAHFELGVCFLNEKKYASAIESFKVSIGKLNNELPNARLFAQFYLGFAQLEQGRRVKQQSTSSSEAISLLTTSTQTFANLLKEAPEFENADQVYFYQGKGFYELERWDDAKTSYTKMLEYQDATNRLEGIVSLADVYTQLGQHQTALDFYDRFLADPASGDSPFRNDVNLQSGKAMIRLATADQKAGLQESSEQKYQQALTRLKSLVDKIDKNISSQSQAEQDVVLDAARTVIDVHLARKEAEKAYQLATDWIAKWPRNKSVVPLLLDQARSADATGTRRPESASLYADVAREFPTHSLAPESLFYSAFAFLDVNQYDDAIEIAEEFEEKFSADDLLAKILEVKADALLLSGKPGLAGKVFETLLREQLAHPNRSLWQLRRGLTLYADEKYEQAVDYFEPLIETFSQPVQKSEALHWLGSSQFRRGNYQGAIKSLALATQAENDWRGADETLLTLCRSHLRAGESEKGKKIAAELATRFPKSPFAQEVVYYLAEQALAEKQYQTAAEKFNEFNQNPTNAQLIPFGLYNAALAQIELGQFAEADKLFAQLIQQHSAHELADKAIVSQAKVRRKTGDSDAAINGLKKIIETNATGESMADALFQTGLAQVEGEKWAEAAKTFTDLIAKFPESTILDRYYFELAWAYKELKNETLALENFEKLTAIPNSLLAGEAYFHLGVAAEDAADFEAAAQAFQQGVKSKSSDSIREKCAYRLARTYFLQEQFDKARQAFIDQTEQFEGPLYADGLFMVGETLCRLKQYDQALAAYRSALPAIEKSLTTPPTRKWLSLLHASQCANKLNKHADAVELINELQSGDPETIDPTILQDAWLEAGIAYAGLSKPDQSRDYFTKATSSQGETGAQAHCMLGDQFFKNKKFNDANDQYKLAQYGFGGYKASEEIRSWQAYAIYGSACCSFERLKEIPTKQSPERIEQQRQRLLAEAIKQFDYLLEHYSDDRLAEEAKKQLKVLKELKTP